MAAEGAAAVEQHQPSAEEIRRRAVRRQQSRRRMIVSVVSTVVVLGLLALIVVSSPGWARVRDTFFDMSYAGEVLPAVAKGLWLNIRLTFFGSIGIAIIGLGLALLRTSTAAALAPFRILAAAYIDIFRGVPILLVILLVGFGVPALELSGITTNIMILGTIAIVLCYSAYVAEVLRSGILSVHPSQKAAARSLGLTHTQALRYVILPQGVRRVIPPLMNDFVSLLKDTGLISVLGVIDAIRAAQIESSKSFNFTPYLVASVLFLLLTVPLTRVTDRVLKRSIERENAQASP